ncbi:MAG: hypothetical protein KC619_17235 [Myxococcales bacterium]|nr:hypothetical protein [Myxococcales bacterium]
MTDAKEVAPLRRRLLEHLGAFAMIALAASLFSAPIHAVPDRMPAGHDYALAISLAEGFAEGIEDGHVYPRWLSRANAGFGLPALVGYPPLSGAMVGVTRHLTGDTMAAFRIVIAMVSLLGGLAFFLFARRFARPLLAGVGAALYVLAPYHFVVLYQRFAFAEFSCAIWVPLVLHFGLSLRARPSLGAALGLAASFAAVVLSHVVVAQMLVVGIGVIVLVASKPWRHPSRALVMGAALAGSLALAGAYVVPLLVSRDLTHWDVQYSASRGVPYMFAVRGDVFTTIVELAFLLQAASLAPLLPMLWRSKNRALVTAVIAALVVTALHTGLSYPIWRWLPGMQYLLYPYRFGLLASAFFPLGVVYLVGRRPVLGGLAAFACAAALIAIPTIFDEPRWVNLHEHPVVVWNQEHIPRTVGSIAERMPMAERVMVAGEGTARVIEWRSHSRQIAAHVTGPGAQLRVATWFYPGWVAEVDGVPQSIGPEAISGLILVDLDHGDHDVALRFVDTPERVVGKWVSLIAWLVFGGLLGIAFVERWRRRRAAAAA